MKISPRQLCILKNIVHRIHNYIFIETNKFLDIIYQEIFILSRKGKHEE